MNKKRTITAAALAAAVFLSCMGPARAVDVSAKSAIVMDAAEGRILFEKNADARSLIASTTKIMTGLLVCESSMELDEAVTVPPEAAGIEGSSLYLKAGESVTVRALLYGMMLHSGNDAAAALAILSAGCVEDFVSQMNARAASLGLQDTHFANPNGLDDAENYGSARDLATLTAYALKNRDFAQAVSAKTYSVGQRCFVNHNKLLWRYEGVIGVKTGYTKAAGRILVSAAKRNGRTLICVTVGAPDDWNDHSKLLDYGFSQYKMSKIAAKGEVLCTVPICAETAESAPLIAQEDVFFPLLAGESVICGFRKNELILAPFMKGDRAGTAILYLGETEIASVRVIWGATVLN